LSDLELRVDEDGAELLVLELDLAAHGANLLGLYRRERLVGVCA
jgi:hypothetical protein